MIQISDPIISQAVQALEIKIGISIQFDHIINSHIINSTNKETREIFLIFGLISEFEAN